MGRGGDVTRPNTDNFVGEFSPTERFGQKSLEQRQPGELLLDRGEIVAADHYKRRLGYLERGAPDELHAIELRHIVVGNDDGWIERYYAVERVEGASKGHDTTIEVFLEHL